MIYRRDILNKHVGKRRSGLTVGSGKEGLSSRAKARITKIPARNFWIEPYPTKNRNPMGKMKQEVLPKNCNIFMSVVIILSHMLRKDKTSRRIIY